MGGICRSVQVADSNKIKIFAQGDPEFALKHLVHFSYKTYRKPERWCPIYG